MTSSYVVVFVYTCMFLSVSAIMDQNPFVVRQLWNSLVLSSSNTDSLGVKCYQSPLLFRTNRGVMILFAEAQIANTCVKRSPNVIVSLRAFTASQQSRSNDSHYSTWSSPKLVVKSPGTKDYFGKSESKGFFNQNSKTEIQLGSVLEHSNNLFVAFTVGNYNIFIATSADEGESFTQLQDLPHIRHWTELWIGFGKSPGLVIPHDTLEPQNTSQILLLPMYASSAWLPDRGWASHCFAIMSIDGGHTWSRQGDSNDYGNIAGVTNMILQYCGETHMVAAHSYNRSFSPILFRTERSLWNERRLSVSKNRGVSWITPSHSDIQSKFFGCHATFVHITSNNNTRTTSARSRCDSLSNKPQLGTLMLISAYGGDSYLQACQMLTFWHAEYDFCTENLVSPWRIIFQRHLKMSYDDTDAGEYVGHIRSTSAVLIQNDRIAVVYEHNPRNSYIGISNEEPSRIYYAEFDISHTLPVNTIHNVYNRNPTLMNTGVSRTPSILNKHRGFDNITEIVEKTTFMSSWLSEFIRFGLVLCSLFLAIYCIYVIIVNLHSTKQHCIWTWCDHNVQRNRIFLFVVVISIIRVCSAVICFGAFIWGLCFNILFIWDNITRYGHYSFVTILMGSLGVLITFFFGTSEANETTETNETNEINETTETNEANESNKTNETSGIHDASKTSVTHNGNELYIIIQDKHYYPLHRLT